MYLSFDGLDGFLDYLYCVRHGGESLKVCSQGNMKLMYPDPLT